MKRLRSSTNEKTQPLLTHTQQRCQSGDKEWATNKKDEKTLLITSHVSQFDESAVCVRLLLTLSGRAHEKKKKRGKRIKRGKVNVLLVLRKTKTKRVMRVNKHEKEKSVFTF